MNRFTKSKTMIFPREIIVGHKTTTQVAELCNRIVRGNKALIVEDKITKKLSGNQISKILIKANYEVKEKIVTSANISEDLHLLLVFQHVHLMMELHLLEHL